MNDLVTLPIPAAAVDRSKFLGGSDVAAIFGVSPWNTPLDLFIKKTSGVKEDLTAERRKFFARRKRQEPVIAEMLADEYGIVVTRLSLDENPNRYTDPDHSFLVAEIDFEFEMSQSVRDAFPARPEFAAIPDGTLLNGEIKTVHPFKAYEWGEQGSEDVPIHYAAQVMHGLGVTRRPAAIVAALFGLDTLLCFPVMADQETIAAMREKAVRFWTQNVQELIPPDPVNLEDVKRMYAGFSGKPVMLSAEAHDALHGLDSVRVREAALKEERSALEWSIARCVAFNWGAQLVPDDKNRPIVKDEENAVLMFEGRQVGSWNRQRGAYLDQKRLAMEKPEITQAYTVEHKYRVFRLKKEKRK
jgi:predicted phage-related endonuclease